VHRKIFCDQVGIVVALKETWVVHRFRFPYQMRSLPGRSLCNRASWAKVSCGEHHDVTDWFELQKHADHICTRSLRPPPQTKTESHRLYIDTRVVAGEGGGIRCPSE
jgi:hypothetical protein